MPHPFFPDPAFGWVFWAALVAILGLASYTDLRFLRIPKSITLSLLGLGVVFNLARGAWVGATGQSVWYLGAGGAWVGAADGLLWSVAGFAVGFTLFFFMYVMGTCGGGDVKLFAALGAWLGPRPTLYVLAGTLLLVSLLLVGRMATRLLWPIRRQATTSLPMKGSGRGLTSYSLSAALSTAILVLWLTSADLQLAPRPLPEPDSSATAPERR